MLQEGSAAAAQRRVPDWALPRRITEAACQGLGSLDHGIPWVGMHHAQLLAQLLHMQLASGQRAAAAAAAEQLRAVLAAGVQRAGGPSSVEAYLQQGFPVTYFDICFRWAACAACPPPACPWLPCCCRCAAEAAAVALRQSPEPSPACCRLAEVQAQQQQVTAARQSLLQGFQAFEAALARQAAFAGCSCRCALGTRPPDTALAALYGCSVALLSRECRA
jgi:hypothetical protein